MPHPTHPAAGWITESETRVGNLRVLVQRTASHADCPQCAGHGMWRLPYTSERVACDLCTSAPISTASAIWPFPANGEPAPQTRGQIKAAARQQAQQATQRLAQLGEAPL